MHTLDPELIRLLNTETDTALACLHRVHDAWSIDPLDARVRRVSAVIVLLEEVEMSFRGHAYTPREVLPWLKCCAHLLARTDGRELSPAKEHVSAACDLLYAYSV